MIYPRLRLARNLLTQDGYLVVSIDDAEFAAMELLLDEVMVSDNKLAVLVWDRNRKNDARFFSVGHEYMLVYARDKQPLRRTGRASVSPNRESRKRASAFGTSVRSSEPTGTRSRRPGANGQARFRLTTSGASSAGSARSAPRPIP